MSKVYLIRCNEETFKYKIGYSKHPEKRLKEVQTSNASKVELLYQFPTKHGRLLETTLHRSFPTSRLEGEWFLLSNDDVQNFSALCKQLEFNFDFLKENQI